MKTILFLGTGYCARYILPHLEQKNWIIYTTHRHIPTTQNCQQNFIKARIAIDDIISGQASQLLSEVTHIVISIPPQKNDPIWEANLVKQFIRLCPNWRSGVYFSASSVYGSHQGQWVDEDAPCQPSTARGRARLHSEGLWRNACPDIHIFRLAGIYGPGRNVFIDLEKDIPFLIDKSGQYFNRIHVADIARYTIFMLEKDLKGGIYNLADNVPSASSDLYRYAAHLLSKPLPPVRDFHDCMHDISDMRRSFYSENKRVNSQKIQQHLPLLYPDWQSGLTNLYKSGYANI